MKRNQTINKIFRLCEKENFYEAFQIANDYNSTHSDEIFMEEDWQTIDGTEYYIVAVDDEMYKVVCE